MSEKQQIGISPPTSFFKKCPDLISDDRRDTTAILENEFKRAKAMQPCIIFLEEFECIACVRGYHPHFIFTLTLLIIIIILLIITIATAIYFI